MALYLYEAAATDALPLTDALEDIRVFGEENKDAPLPLDVRRALKDASRLLRNAQLWYKMTITGH